VDGLARLGIETFGDSLTIYISVCMAYALNTVDTGALVPQLIHHYLQSRYRQLYAKCDKEWDVSDKGNAMVFIQLPTRRDSLNLSSTLTNKTLATYPLPTIRPTNLKPQANYIKTTILQTQIGHRSIMMQVSLTQHLSVRRPLLTYRALVRSRDWDAMKTRVLSPCLQNSQSSH